MRYRVVLQFEQAQLAQLAAPTMLMLPKRCGCGMTCRQCNGRHDFVRLPQKRKNRVFLRRVGTNTSKFDVSRVVASLVLEELSNFSRVS